MPTFDLKKPSTRKKSHRIKLFSPFSSYIAGNGAGKKRRENGGRYRYGGEKKYIFAFFSFLFLFSAFDASPVIFATKEEEEEEARSANDTSDREEEEDQTGEEEEDKTEKPSPGYFHARIIWRVQSAQSARHYFCYSPKAFPPKKSFKKEILYYAFCHWFSAFF